MSIILNEILKLLFLYALLFGEIYRLQFYINHGVDANAAIMYTGHWLEKSYMGLELMDSMSQLRLLQLGSAVDIRNVMLWCS